MEYGSRKTRGVESFSLVESLLWNLFCAISFVLSSKPCMVTEVVLVFGYGGEGGKGSNPVQDNLKTLGTPSGPVLATLTATLWLQSRCVG